MKQIQGRFLLQSNKDFPADCEMLDYMQTNAHVVSIIGNLAGDKAILLGCALTGGGTQRNEGYVFLRTKEHPEGEVLYWEGGSISGGMYLKQAAIPVQAQGYEYPQAYVERSLAPGVGEENYKWEDFREAQSLPELEAQIVVTAAAGIRAFTVEIISEEVLTPEVLDAVGLAPELDLVSPGDYKEPLEGLGFPTGEKVVGQTSVSFDISPFMPLIPLLGTGDSDFRLTVTDNEGQTTVASIMVHSTNGEAPEPEGPEEEYPGGDAKPLEPPHAGQPYPGGDAKPIHNTQKITTIR